MSRRSHFYNPGSGVWQVVSCSMNDSLLGDNNRDSSGNNPAPTSLAKISAPPSTVMRVEAYGATMDLNNAAAASDYSTGATARWGVLPLCHWRPFRTHPAAMEEHHRQSTRSAGSNYLAAGGHVKWLKAASIPRVKPLRVRIMPKTTPASRLFERQWRRAAMTFSKI
jgi:hypothetical protein